VLTREDRAKGGRARAAKARERKESLRHDHRSSARLVEAAERLGEMLRSDNLRTAMWADHVVSRYILGESSRWVAPGERLGRAACRGTRAEERRHLVVEILLRRAGRGVRARR
jgi:hypothetical protein